MPELARSLLLVEAHDAACGEHGHDRTYPEFRGFLQRPVHAFAARDALHERDREGRLAEPPGALAEPDPHAIALDRHDLTMEIAATAVEEDERRAGPQAQHARHVAGRGLGQPDLGTLREGRRHVEAVQSHVASVMPSRAVATSRSISSGSITYGGMK